MPLIDELILTATVASRRLQAAFMFINTGRGPSFGKQIPQINLPLYDKAL